MATQLTASGINALFSTLESTRIAHAAGPTQTSSSLGTSFSGYQVTAGTKAQSVTINNIKAALTTLASSRYMNGTNYGTSITSPSTGTLIQETLFNTSRTQVEAAAAVCVNDSSYYNSNRSGYDSSYRNNRSGYNASYRDYNSPHYDGYRGSYRSSDNSSIRSTYQSTWRNNNSSNYGGNGVICTGNR